MIISYQRGHKILFINNEWLYADDMTTIEIERPCVKCDHMPTANGHDWCMQNIPNKTSVCCGHGVNNKISK